MKNIFKQALKWLLKPNKHELKQFKFIENLFKNLLSLFYVYLKYILNMFWIYFKYILKLVLKNIKIYY